MIPKIRKIPYATDLSDNSAHAFRYAIRAAERYDASIVILHVLKPMAYASTASYIGYYLDKEEQKRLLGEDINFTMYRIRTWLKMFAERELKDEPLCADKIVSIGVCHGYPVDVVLRKADELDCDAIVMGIHGKGKLRHTFLGSTARKIRRRVRKPVFIIPLPKGEKDITFQNV